MEPILLIVVFLAALIAGPLLLYFPVYLYCFFKARRAWKKRELDFKPSVALLLVYLWFLLTLPGLGVMAHNFLTFSARAPQAEAKTNLGAIFTCQVAYYGEYNTYAGRKGEDGRGAFADMGWGPEGNTRYAYFAGGDYIAPTRPGLEVTYRPDGDWPFSVRPESASQGFTVMAVGNVDRDQCHDVWVMNDAKSLHNLVNDVGTPCPRGDKSEWVWKTWDLLKPFLAAAFGIFGALSPAMLVVVPGLYVRLVRERRLYREALAIESNRD